MEFSGMTIADLLKGLDREKTAEETFNEKIAEALEPKTEVVTEPAPVAEPVTEPAPVVDPAPATEPAPVVDPAPATEPAPVAEPVAEPVEKTAEEIEKQAELEKLAELDAEGRVMADAFFDQFLKLAAEFDSQNVDAPSVNTIEKTAQEDTDNGAQYILNTLAEKYL